MLDQLRDCEASIGRWPAILRTLAYSVLRRSVCYWMLVRQLKHLGTPFDYIAFLEDDILLTDADFS